MKKMVILLFTAALLATTAFADILINLDDSFWHSHRDDCVNRRRTYTVNSPEGSAALWESPVSSKQTETLPNGTELNGSWRYTDEKGETWFTVESGEQNSNGEEILRGWCRESDCLATPDAVSFEEAHGAEFEGWDRAYDHVFDEAEDIIIWKYPGSGEVKGEIWGPSYDPAWLRDEFDTCWRDQQGRMWAYLDRILQNRDVWICLDALGSTELEKDETILPDTGTVYQAADKLPQPTSGLGGLTIVAVAAVVVITILLLFLFFRKHKTGTPPA